MRPSPVIDAARPAAYLYAAGPALVAVLAGAGLATGKARAALVATAAVGVAAAAVNLLEPLRRARRVTEVVTPVSDPRDVDGRLLRPITITVQEVAGW